MAHRVLLKHRARRFLIKCNSQERQISILFESHFPTKHKNVLISQQEMVSLSNVFDLLVDALDLSKLNPNVLFTISLIVLLVIFYFVVKCVVRKTSVFPSLDGSYATDVVFGVFIFEVLYRKIYLPFIIFRKNKAIIQDSLNVTIYDKQEDFCFQDLKKYYIFKKCNFSLNQYYWKVKTRDFKLYYTATDNEKGTIKSIMQATRISELHRKLVNDFFEYCLISYVCKEDINVMDKLSKGKEVKLENGVMVKTQDYFLNSDNQCSEVDSNARGDGSIDSKSPDLYLSYEGSSLLVEAYNGSNQKEYLKKFHKYRNKATSMYVFVSGVSRIEQFSVKNRQQFKFFNESDEEVSVLQIGPLEIDIREIRDKYMDQYKKFYNEVNYWERCEIIDEIIRTDGSDPEQLF
jgi:hypothetical protein